MQVSGGPNAVVGNTYYTLISQPCCCALAANMGGFGGLIGTNAANFSTCFIGNQVYGGRNGQSPQNSETGRSNTINFSGNCLTLYPPYDQSGDDYPGAAAFLQNSASSSVIGNTLVSGSQGVLFGTDCGTRSL